MNSQLVLALSVLALYIILGTFLAVMSRRSLKGGLEDFFVAGGRLGGLLSALTYAATTYSGFMIVGLVGFAYFRGVGALGFELVYYVATLGLLLLFASRVNREAKERRWITPSQMLGDATRLRYIPAVTAILYMVALIPYASSQVKSIGEAFAGLAGGYYIAGVILGVAIMIVWSAIAGIWSVAVTDALQGIWMLASATLLLGFVVNELASMGIGIGEAWDILSNTDPGLTTLDKYWTPGVFLAFTLPWMFFAVTNPQVVQRLYMPRDERSIRDMIRWFGVFGLYYTVLVVLIGLLARAGAASGALDISPEKIDQVTPQLLAVAHPLLAALVFTSIVAAAASTTDSIILTLSSVLAVDLGRGDEESRRKLALAGIVLFGFAMAAVAGLRISYIVKLSLLSSLMLLSLAPVTILAWAGWSPTSKLAYASILAGPVMVGVETWRLGSPLAAMLSQPLGVPLALWILIASTVLAIASVKK